MDSVIASLDLSFSSRIPTIEVCKSSSLFNPSCGRNPSDYCCYPCAKWAGEKPLATFMVQPIVPSSLSPELRHAHSTGAQKRCIVGKVRVVVRRDDNVQHFVRAHSMFDWLTGLAGGFGDRFTGAWNDRTSDACSLQKRGTLTCLGCKGCFVHCVICRYGTLHFLGRIQPASIPVPII